MLLVRTAALTLCIIIAASAGAAPAGSASIGRVEAPFRIDALLDEPAWQQATKYERWYETNPGDNVEPKVRTVGLVAYDDRFLYIAIESSDPNPSQIRAVYADHDQISGNADDFAGVILDTRNDGKTATEFFVTARGVQFDAVNDDSAGIEDASPDFFWDSAARIHDKGWTLEMRIPFSSLRYDNPNPEQWGLILYRNFPRDRRYQIFTSRLPRESNCFVCNFGKVTGMRGLPAGDHMVVAPYVTAQQLSEPRNGLGSKLSSQPLGSDAGLDLKWSPTADMAVDATVNPDFSQIESDVAVISTNERFAVFISEKRPFFLEGVELFNTPIQAVYTRTLTSPGWGARTTGKTGDYGYTLLVAQDRGGGSVILPSAHGSGFASQDFSSIAAIGRVRRDFGRSFISILGTAREAEGDAHNRVFGPDFQWRIGEKNTITGQLLFSSTKTPDRPDLASEWNGQSLAGHAGFAWWSYSDAKRDVYVNYSDYDDEFRADNGFVPQVGWRGTFAEAGYTTRPKGFFSRARYFAFGEYQQTQDGALLYRLASAGVGTDGKFRSFTRFRVAHDTVANEGELFDRDRLYYQVNFAVSRVLSSVNFDGWIGDEVDFSNNRPGRGANMNASATLRPTDHLQISITSGLRWLSLSGDRLFTSQVQRVRATYTFNSRTFLRTIVQNQRTNRDRDLYANVPDSSTDPVPTIDVAQHSGSLAAQLLFAYKLNWQTVFYVGFGDLQEVTGEEGVFRRANRQLFAKISYAFQK
ncbi:MAG: DUF5916 domain-containing protein [Thermoanaerobaculia bacterium]